MSEDLQLPHSLSLSFVEDLYALYSRNPSSVPSDWKNYFDAISTNSPKPGSVRLSPSFSPPTLFNGTNARSAAPLKDSGRASALQERVDQLIRNYRVRGHRAADVDPLGAPKPRLPELSPEYYGFDRSDMDREFSCRSMCGEGVLPLREILARLQTTYCRTIGVQFMHIDDSAVRDWLQLRMESVQNRVALSREEQLRILTRLTDAEIFEEFIRKKFIGAKSFSLEGSESLIPLLDLAIEKAGSDGIDEIVLAMAHRGRLNVLANILGKSPREIFREFADSDPETFIGKGDVKYHLGYSSDWKTAGGHRVHLSICFNPSHLEFVNPVALGRMRAKQDRAGDAQRERGMVLLIHGDASFAGEGIIQEIFNLSGLEGYSVGGTLHVVVNNQVGFTTSPGQATSSPYCTDVARMLQIPIFHVNGEDPEAVAQVVRLAMDFRRTFRRDAVIDMYCYRRLGHSEGDEPSFTQPLLYKAIADRQTTREGYLAHLLKLEGVTREDADEIARIRNEHLSQELSQAQEPEPRRQPGVPGGIWTGYAGGPESDVAEADTGVDRERLSELLEAQTRLPEGFHIHPKLKNGIQRRLQMARGEQPLDWSSAEGLAFASLAAEGIRVRLSGQDSERGTFSQRHSVLHDVENDQLYRPLQNVDPYQAPVETFNSPLSEAGVLGFEYGYSLDCPDGLTIWEAQYGDFVNAAQVIVDQFLAAAEDKWQRLSGVVLLLPHGFEGAGPEHSSARLERFLQLAAEDNLQVACPTTPAQYFHLLRRQVLRRWRKPLIVMTPKSLLRHPQATSSLEDLATGGFQRLLHDVAGQQNVKRRILLCGGKIYYDLEKAREERKIQDVALLRIEQLYPLRDAVLRHALEPYRSGTPVVWVQEEPENMGAWRYLHSRFGDKLMDRFPFAVSSRPASASPATGSASSHRLEQERLIAEAFRS
jgi:2-oxoglutarate dehydrogenase E1 component